MKKILLLVASFVAFNLSAQTFTDDFENYTVGAFVAKTNTKWTTWANKPGTTEDTKISAEQAHSGKQSAKFISTAAAGGPTDLVLPFFGSLTKIQDVGVFENTMWFYVPAKKTAYFNYQAVAPVGKTWALDVNFNADSSFVVTCSGAGGVQGKAKFIPGTWVKYSSIVDLTSNTWSINLDDKEVAKFTTSNNSLFALNIYPSDAQSTFYVDDVETKFTPFVAKQSDAGMTAVSMKARAIKGKEYSVGGTFRNFGKDTITTLDYAWTDGVSSYTESLKGLKILPLASYTFKATEPYFADPVGNKLSFTITKVNGKADDDASNNKKGLNIAVVIPAPGKKVIAEQATGTWCQWCPRGHVFMELMEKEYPEYFIGIAAHGGSATEPMNLPDYVNVVLDPDPAQAGFPSVTLDRGERFNPSEIENRFFDRLVEAAQAKVENKATYNKTTRDIKADIKVTFNNTVKKGTYKLMVLVVEDSIKGVGSAYNQVNAYAGGASGVMGGYEKLTNPVPASKMIYQHVARFVMTDIAGDELKLDPKDGEVISKSFTYTVPATHKEKQLELVAYVLDDNDFIVNGTRLDYKNFAFTTASNDVSEHPYFNNIYPNPTTNTTYIDLNIKELSDVKINVVDLSGRTVASRDYGQMSGESVFPLHCGDLATGIYTVRIQIGTQIITKKLVKE
jgi:hypothetical protein